MTTERSRRRRREHGSTLLEMMISLLCFSVIGVGVVGVTTSSSRAMKTNATMFECQSRASRCVDKLARHLRAASLGTLLTLPDGFETNQPVEEGVEMDDLTWQSFAFNPDTPASVPDLGAPFTLATTATPSDPANGVDDDHDGVVDDVDVSFARPGMAAEVVARDVSDCSFVLDGRTLTISVQVRMRNSDGAPTFARATRVVEIRND